MLNRPVRALTTWPDGRAWRRLAVIFALYIVFAALFSGKSGFVELAPLPLTGWGYLRLGLVLLVAPSGLEEVVFRGFLLPRLGEQGALPYAALSLGLYVLSHPANALLLRPAALPVFADPRFLALVTLLGAACTAAAWVSGSLWPPILIHWLTVFVWLGFLGGRAALGGPVGGG